VTRLKRNMLIINEQKVEKTITIEEQQTMIMISSLIGDSDNIDIDDDDMLEATGLTDINKVFSILDLMFELGILVDLDYEEGYIG